MSGRMKSMNTAEKFATAMVVERIVVGGAAIIAPGPMLKGFGAPADADTPALRYTTRLFGIRNVALGVQVWQARKDQTRLTTLADQNATVELTDLVVGAVVTSTDPEMRRPGVAVMVTSLAVASGFLVLRRLAARP